MKTPDPQPGIKLNRDWLLENRNRYYGYWVALRDGELLGFDRRLADLMRKVGKDKTIYYIWA